MKKIPLLIFGVFVLSYCHAQVDSAGLNNVFGRKGTVTGNVYRVTFPRSDLKISVGGFSVAPGLALTSWVALHRMGPESMMMGDLCMLDSEEPAVVAKLVELGLSVTAIHNHMLYDEPRLFMMHFWGVGDPGKIAEGLKAALDQTNSKR